MSCGSYKRYEYDPTVCAKNMLYNKQKRQNYEEASVTEYFPTHDDDFLVVSHISLLLYFHKGPHQLRFLPLWNYIVGIIICCTSLISFVN